MLTLSQKLSRNITKLRLELLLQTILLFSIAIAFIYFLIYLDRIYKPSENLNGKIIISIMGHESLFPAMNDTVFISTLIVLLLTIATAISYQLYYFYKHKKERIESKTMQKKQVSMKRFLPFFIFCVFHAMFDFVYEELCVAFQQSLKGIDFRNKYLWVTYMIILCMIIADQLVEVAEIHLLNDKLSLVGKTSEAEEKTEKDTWKTWGLKLLSISIIALALIFISIGLNKLPISIMKAVPITVDGQIIIFFDNTNNALILSILPIVLVAFIVKCIFPSLERIGNKNPNNDSLSTHHEKWTTQTISALGTGGQTIGLALARALLVNLAISATNTLQKINLSSPAVIIPILQLLTASTLLVLLQILQFCEEEQEKNYCSEPKPQINIQAAEEVVKQFTKI